MMTAEQSRVWRRLIVWVRNEHAWADNRVQGWRTRLREAYIEFNFRECSVPDCHKIICNNLFQHFTCSRPCVVCDKCQTCCECIVCKSGHHGMDDANERCPSCTSCSEHCDCSLCNACEEMHRDSNCETCNTCRDCCDCIFCEGCDTNIRGGRNMCGECSRCTNDCCECESDERQVELFESDLTFHTAKRNQFKFNASKRYIAAEIEVAAVDSDDGISSTVGNWKGCIVEDGSLPDTGFEINTAPANGDLFVKQITQICNSLNRSDAKVTADCGLHIHLDGRDLDYYAIRRLIRLYQKLELVIKEMVPSNRRSSTYCKPCGDYYARGVGPLQNYKEERKKLRKTIYRTDGEINDERTNKYNGSRYYALNLHSWFYRGTIEIRLFNGTTNADKITSWGMMWALIIDKAASCTEAELEALMHYKNAYKVLRSIVGNVEPVIRFIDERLKQHGNSGVNAWVDAYNGGHEIQVNDAPEVVSEVKAPLTAENIVANPELLMSFRRFINMTCLDSCCEGPVRRRLLDGGYEDRYLARFSAEQTV